MRTKILTVFMGLALAAVSGQTAEPTIKYEINGTNLIVTYTGTLYQSTDAVNWTEVKSASSPYKVKIEDKKLFFCSQGGSAQPIVPGEDFSTSLPGGVSLDMLWLDPATFTMGSPKEELGRYSDEVQHQVTLTQGYWLGKYEVTQAQYEAVMGTNPSYYKGADLPVETVSWNDAMEFCAKLTAIEREAGRLPRTYEYTLPTEAQWEYACRAGTTTAFNNGMNIPSADQCWDQPCPNLDRVGWYGSNSDEMSHPVGQKRSNLWDFYDMHGNVWEMCSDWYGDYPTSAVYDPTGPGKGTKRVARGGGWSSGAGGCRSAYRDYVAPDTQGGNIGFRVALISNNKTIPLSDDVRLEMIWIEPGTFMMGSPEDELGRKDDETQHQVTLTQGYWLGKYEVTRAQYEAVMRKDISYSTIRTDYPVGSVKWFDAMEFCEKLTVIEREAGRLPRGYKYTLPTEAQWEYACRAGTITALNSGKDLSDVDQCPEMDEVGWYMYNSDDKTHPVGQKQPNAWGLYDMHGNVYEWCLDWYGDYPASSVNDPIGPDTGSKRVHRGGCCSSPANGCRSAYRNCDNPKYAHSRRGFRVALVRSKDMTIPLADGVELEMVWIEPGTFTMGSPEDELGRNSGEKQHEVTLTQGYWLGRYEVTQAQYEAIKGKNPSWFKGADLPVECVSWYDAKEFCAILTTIERMNGRLPEGYEYTLPTEAQWEYACRAGTTTALNNGKNLSGEWECPEMDEVGWYWCGREEDKTTHPVGQKKPNVWGLYDMHGNVWEWCLDWYEWGSYYPTSSMIDPTGPDKGSECVIRGGSRNYTAPYCRSASRDGDTPTGSNFGIGFRVALTTVPVSKDMTIPLAENVNLKLIWINPGTFKMGSPKDELGRENNETLHQVTLTKGYWLGRYEVTQAQYEAVTGKNLSNWKGADLPVECVSWNDATEFCNKLTEIEKVAGRLPEGYEYTLPTEAQWEYACRAGTTTALNNGKNLSSEWECPEMDEVGWYRYNSFSKTHPVGQKMPNAWGLYDMHGNVWEWCLDCYGDYPTSSVTDPKGPSTGSYRVIRGGGWDIYAPYCRSAYRINYDPSNGRSYVGFRVALAPVK